MQHPDLNRIRKKLKIGAENGSSHTPQEDELFLSRIHKRIQINRELTSRFLKEAEVWVRYWVFVKADFGRARLLELANGGVRREKVSKSGKAAGKVYNYQRDLIEDVEALFTQEDQFGPFHETSEKEKVILVEPPHVLLGFEYDFVLVLLARNEYIIGDFVTHLHTFPAISGTHTATNIFFKEEFDYSLITKRYRGKRLRGKAIKLRKKNQVGIENFKKIISWCMANSDSRKMQGEIAEEIGISVPTLREGWGFFQRNNFIQEGTIDPRVHRRIFGKEPRWPVCYWIFIQAKCETVPGGAGQAPQLSLKKEIESDFESGANVIGNITLKEFSLLELRVLLGFEYDLLLVLLADHEDAAGWFVTSYLHKRKGITRTFTATSLPSIADIGFRREVDDRLGKTAPELPA
jgi:hypothetical protein